MHVDDSHEIAYTLRQPLKFINTCKSTHLHGEISIIVSANTKISLASEACCFTLGAGEAEIREKRL